MTAVPPSVPRGRAAVPAASTVPAAPAAGTRSRSRRAWALTGSIALAVLCSLLAMSAGGNYSDSDSTFLPWIQASAMIGVFPMIGISVLLVWRHRFPVLVSVLAIGLAILLPTTSLPALVALAAVGAVRTGWPRWALIAGAYIAVTVSLCWDVASHTSLLAGFFGDPAAGTPARLMLFWAIPIVAAVMVAPFAAWGLTRRMRAERDSARLGSAAATRNVAALHQEVERERDRQELARELHDTLAARLSSLSLHAGALELTVGAADENATAAARAVRESAQHSLDDLRHVVQVLRNPASSVGAGTGLADLASLIDGAGRDGTDVRAQVLVGDPATCDPRVAHTCYRIVQEAISNVRRHAPGRPIRVDVRGGPETGLTVTAANWLIQSARRAPTGTGLGLQGMAERVALVGGSFQAGPTPDGTFAVIVWLPWSVA